MTGIRYKFIDIFDTSFIKSNESIKAVTIYKKVLRNLMSSQISKYLIYLSKPSAFLKFCIKSNKVYTKSNVGLIL